MAWNQPGKKTNKPAEKYPVPPGDGGKNGMPPPGLDEVLRKLNGFFGDNFSPVKIAVGVVCALILIYGVLGLHWPGADEKAVVFRFGKLMTVQDAGLHWNPPGVDVIKTLNVTRLEQAVVTADVVTADENILGVTLVVHYRISDVRDYLLNFSDAESGLVHAAESALREVAASVAMADLVRDERARLAENIARKLQATLASYHMGLTVSEVSLTDVLPTTEVKAAFDAVVHAREEAGRQQAVARTEAEKAVPAVRTEAARLLAAADDYAHDASSRASAEAARFESVLGEYRKAPAVIRSRLYYETMEAVLAKTRTVIMDGQNQQSFGLPLDKMTLPVDASAAPAGKAVAVPEKPAPEAVPKKPEAVSTKGVRQ